MADQSALVINVDGNTYTVRMADLSANDAKDFRAAVGVSLAQVMADGSFDLDAVAGLVWLVRRKRERGLAYQKVAAAITYDSDIDMEETGGEGEDDPET